MSIKAKALAKSFIGGKIAAQLNEKIPKNISLDSNALANALAENLPVSASALQQELKSLPTNLDAQALGGILADKYGLDASTVTNAIKSKVGTNVNMHLQQVPSIPGLSVDLSVLPIPSSLSVDSILEKTGTLGFVNDKIEDLQKDIEDKIPDVDLGTPCKNDDENVEVKSDRIVTADPNAQPLGPITLVDAAGEVVEAPEEEMEDECEKSNFIKQLEEKLCQHDYLNGTRSRHRKLGIAIPRISFFFSGGSYAKGAILDIIASLADKVKIPVLSCLIGELDRLSNNVAGIALNAVLNGKGDSLALVNQISNITNNSTRMLEKELTGKLGTDTIKGLKSNINGMTRNMVADIRKNGVRPKNQELPKSSALLNPFEVSIRDDDII